MGKLSQQYFKLATYVLQADVFNEAPIIALSTLLQFLTPLLILVIYLYSTISVNGI